MRLNKNEIIQPLKLQKEIVQLDPYCSFYVGYLVLKFLCTSGEENVIWKYQHCGFFPFQDYLISQSMSDYYLLGLRYNESKKKWEWINGKEHSTDM